MGPRICCLCAWHGVYQTVKNVLKQIISYGSVTLEFVNEDDDTIYLLLR